MTIHSVYNVIWLNIPGEQAVPYFQPPPWGPPVDKTHPPAPGASVSSGSLSLSLAGPAQLALLQSQKLGTIPTSAPGHCCPLADAAVPAGAQH